MKILNAEQIKAADKYTIEKTPILSIDLMERAATHCTNRICDLYDNTHEFVIFVGIGNNGGDGLVIARLLLQRDYKVKVYVLNLNNNQYSPDFEINFERLSKIAQHDIKIMSKISDLPQLNRSQIIVDAIFGSGLNRTLAGFPKKVVQKINKSKADVIAIDIPSGLFDQKNHLSQQTIIKAKHTLTFEFPFLSFFFPENEAFVGDFEIIEIGILEKFKKKVKTNYHFGEAHQLKKRIKKRSKFSHKGTFGHGLVLAGSLEKRGACVFVVRAAHRMGAGLITAVASKATSLGLGILSPETMLKIDKNANFITKLPDLSPYNAIAIGCGIGFETKTIKVFKKLIATAKVPLVIDADAITMLSQNKDWLNEIPQNSMLTPHPKEFERLFGKSKTNFERNQMQVHFAQKYQLIIVLKGAYTCIATPDGKSHFNPSGNPAMATAGSGDVLTGVILALLAQNYSPKNAAILGVYLHGLAGDRAASASKRNAIIASDIIDYL